MKYMLLIYGAEENWTEAERHSCMIDSMKICRQLEAQGKYIASSPLQSVNTAKTVRGTAGQPQVTTGPFTETVEQLGGFYLLQLDNLDEAIAIASQLPPASKGTVEIRPVVILNDLPTDRFELIDQHAPSLKPYMLLCYDNESAWQELGDEALDQAMREATLLCSELHARGCYVCAAPLHAAETATSLKMRDGKRVLTDGPYAETREVLGGFYLILAKNDDEALELAARHPGLPFGGVEIRPLFELSKLGTC